MTTEEIREFSRECLMQALYYSGYDIRVPSEETGRTLACDFLFSEYETRHILAIVPYFEREWEAKDFIMRMYGPDDDFEREYPGEYSLFLESRGAVSTVFYLPYLYCLDTHGGENICGGQYDIEFMDYEVRSPDLPTAGPNLPEYEMYKGYAEAWVTGDISFMEDYLLMEFRALADGRFLTSPSKAALLSWFRHQQKSLAEDGGSYSYDLIRVPKTGQQGILMYRNDRPQAFVELEFRDFRVYRSYTHEVPEEYEYWLPQIDIAQEPCMYMNFFGGDKAYEMTLKCINEGFIGYQASDVKLMNKGEEFVSGVSVAVYGETYVGDSSFYDIGIQGIAVFDLDGPMDDLLDIYPNVYGYTVQVTITDVMEWENTLEAQVKARYTQGDEDVEITFFALDYFERRDEYVVGAEVKIDLGAVSNGVRKGESYVELTGEAALNFLHEVGKEPDFDENGVMKPVRINMRNSSAYLPRFEDHPDMAEFHSPVLSPVKHIPFCGKDYNMVEILLDSAAGLVVPLYFPADYTPEEGDTICGVLWLSATLNFD